MGDILSFLRQFKIGPFAIFDTAISYLGIYLISPLLSALFKKLHVNITVWSWLWLTIPISVVFHMIFNQDTALMNMLLSPDSYYLAKIVVLFMAIMGLRLIKVLR